MIDVYIRESPLGEGYVRICDFGMALMRLSYSFDINTDAKQRIFDSIIINNGVENGDGDLYLDVPLDGLYEGILQFAGCVQKVCNMSYWNRETVRSAFYDDLSLYITTEMREFDPLPDLYPIPEYPISVDWSLTHNQRTFYVFGVRGNNRALNVAVSLLEYQKAGLGFISIIVHEDMEELGRRERIYLTRNSDRQYPLLNDFQEMSRADIERLAGVPT